MDFVENKTSEKNPRHTHRRVAFLGLASLAGEHNQTGLVCLQPLDVNLLALFTEISPSVVNNDSNTTSLLPSNTGLLELCEGKSTTLTNFAVVPDSLSTNSRAEKGERADAECGSFCFARGASAKLAPWLVEPGAHATLPILPEMVGVED